MEGSKSFQSKESTANFFSDFVLISVPSMSKAIKPVCAGAAISENARHSYEWCTSQQRDQNIVT